MAIKDITKDAVKRAIGEYDDKGSEYMFSNYGGGPSRTYHLEHGGKYYPQKLIVRVAHGYLIGEQFLKARGDGASATKTRRLLEKLGFMIISNPLGRM